MSRKHIVHKLVLSTNQVAETLVYKTCLQTMQLSQTCLQTMQWSQTCLQTIKCSQTCLQTM